MEKVAKLQVRERDELFRLSAAKKGVIEALIEKDFWVCLVLKSVFESEGLKEHLLFKGGTSLSKCYNIIERFSEDVDLILDWRVLGIRDEEVWEKRSATQQDKFNNHIDFLGRKYIAASIAPRLKAVLEEKTDGKMVLNIDKEDGHIITVHYPASFSGSYLLDYIKLEIGPRASWVPHKKVTIRSYAAHEYPQTFETVDFSVRVITSERTFWEKATILHQIASVAEDKPVPPRCSRHYYDLFQMIRSPVKENALADPELLKQVSEFKNRFYRSPRARYDLAKPGSFRILPSNKKQAFLEEDYKKMQEMIFKDAPAFNDIINVLEELEDGINNLEQDK